MDINSTTLLKAAQIMAPQLGLRYPEDRDEVVLYVNKYRNLLYNMYPEERLFDNYKACCCVQTFKQPCNDPCDSCDDTYYGITIPDDMAGIVAAWEYQAPLHLRSRWREVHTGLHTGNSLHKELVEMADTSVTEKEMTKTSRLRIYTYEAADEGKEVIIKARTPQGDVKTLTFKLEYDGYVVVPTDVCSIVSVVLPDLCRHIELSQEDGTVLSVYYPHEHVPRYRRYKLNAPCGAKYILVQGTRQYQDITLDTDVVEIGDRLALEMAGRYFKYTEKTIETADINRGEYDLAKFKEQISGIVERHRGRMMQDRSPFNRRPHRPVRKGLSGYNRSHRR